MRIRSWFLMSLALLVVICGPAHAQAVAVFDFEFIDTSLQGEIDGAGADELTPIASEARATNLQACGGCDTHLAKRVGAELAVTGTVQKVSNLILNMNIYVRDVSSGTTVAAMSADMRGNSDESWSRTLDWLIRNRLLAPGYGVRQ
jgi:hypothetical protein